MKMIIHDLEPDVFRTMFKDARNIYVLDKSIPIHHCIGCFGCWLKTPAKCLFNDALQEMGRSVSHCSELTIITRGAYGGYSPEVKTIVDRILAYILPFFVKRNNELHHPMRYDNRLRLEAHFYGAMTAAEQETARKLVLANAINMNDHKPECQAYFHDGVAALKGVVL